MNNLLNTKIVEVLEKGGYSKDFIKGIMKKNEWLPKNFAFRKDALDLLLARYKKKITDFIHDTYPEKDWKNKSVQIHKLLNPKKNQPKYYTDTDLANDLSHWVNTFTDKEDTLISANFFYGETILINVIGSLFGDGQVGLHKGKDITQISSHPKYAKCNAIISKIGSSNGLIRLYQPTKTIDFKADNRFGVCQDAKSKIVWFGFIEPQSNGRYSILDKSYSTGKTIGKLAENIKLSWSAQVKAAYYPTIYNT